jgi:hypothetical protein
LQILANTYPDISMTFQAVATIFGDWQETTRNSNGQTNSKAVTQDDHAVVLEKIATETEQDAELQHLIKHATKTGVWNKKDSILNKSRTLTYKQNCTKQKTSSFDWRAEGEKRGRLQLLRRASNLVPRAFIWGRGETRESPGLGRSRDDKKWQHLTATRQGVARYSLMKYT